MSRFFRLAQQQVARNPVARAVAKAAMVQAVRDFLIAVYLLPDGVGQASNVQAAATALAVAMRLRELDGKADDPDARVITGAMSALAQCAERGFRWRKLDAPAIDAGLTRALDTLQQATPTDLQRAWHYVRRLEA